MASNRLWLVQFLEILLLFLSQSLPSNLNRFINSIHTAESNNWAANLLVDPSQSNLRHLPAFLLSEFLYTVYDFGINFSEAFL
jgi:hypothetical protein